MPRRKKGVGMVVVYEIENLILDRFFGLSLGKTCFGCKRYMIDLSLYDSDSVGFSHDLTYFREPSKVQMCPTNI